MKKMVASIVATGFLATAAMAHFQLNYTPNSALEGPQTIKLLQVFNHPFEDEHTMDMAGVEEFYVINRGNKTDLKKDMKPISFKGNVNSGKGYETSYNARRMGDHVFVLVPKPYYEKSEDIYIQQITKTIVNVAGMPTDWDEELGLKAEIVPLTKPYAILEGGTFSGVVKSNGEVVPYAEIEVEYLNSDIDMAKRAMGPLKYEASNDAMNTLVVKANANGEFTFGLPKAGWWGFAAMEIGPDDEFNGKELEQSAVLWVEVKPWEKR